MQPSESSATNNQNWLWRTSLIWNHMDAWQVAMVVASLPLLIHKIVTIRAYFLLLAIGAGYWFAFALNDYFDAPVDALDPQKKRRNYFTVPNRFRSHGFFALGLFVILFETIVFIQFGLLGIFFFLLSIFIMWAYSAPPLRLKYRPGLDLLTHAFFVQSYVYVVMMLLIEADWTLSDVILIGILVLASLSAQLEQQLRDFDVDALANHTVTTVWGKRWTRRVLIVATAVVIGVALLFGILGVLTPLLWPYLLISLPALLHRFFRHPQTPRSEHLVLISTSSAFVYTIGALFWIAWFG